MHFTTRAKKKYFLHATTIITIDIGRKLSNGYIILIVRKKTSYGWANCWSSIVTGTALNRVLIVPSQEKVFLDELLC